MLSWVHSRSLYLYTKYKNADSFQGISLYSVVSTPCELYFQGTCVLPKIVEIFVDKQVSRAKTNLCIRGKIVIHE